MNIFAIIWMISAVLSLLYGLLVFRTGSGSSFFLVWFLISYFFVLCAFLSFSHRWSHTAGSFRLCFLLLTGIGAAVLALCSVLILTAFSDKGEEGLDYVIVLGCQVRPDGSLSRSLHSRLDAADSYLKKNPETEVIVSGGKGANEPCPEASAMAEYLVHHGIIRSRIHLEAKSVSTRENLLFSSRLCDPGRDRIGIVTNNYHVFRSLFLAKKMGFQKVCGIAAPSTVFYLPNNILREAIALMKDFLFP